MKYILKTTSFRLLCTVRTYLWWKCWGVVVVCLFWRNIQSAILDWNDVLEMQGDSKGQAILEARRQIKEKGGLLSCGWVGYALPPIIREQRASCLAGCKEGGGSPGLAVQGCGRDGTLLLFSVLLLLLL